MTTKTLRRPVEAPPLYAQDGKGYEAIVYAHYFVGDSDWLITEYSPDDDDAFGWACLGGDRQSAELGYVSMAELAAVRAPIVFNGERIERVLPVEYELDWAPCPLSVAIAMLDRRHGRAS